MNKTHETPISGICVDEARLTASCWRGRAHHLRMIANVIENRSAKESLMRQAQAWSAMADHLEGLEPCAPAEIAPGILAVSGR